MLCRQSLDTEMGWIKPFFSEGRGFEMFLSPGRNDEAVIDNYIGSEGGEYACAVL
jgi:hypothetical protein